MRSIRIKKGLDLKIVGAPAQTLTPGRKLTEVALLGADYIGMKPAMKVAVGDKVSLGQELFVDRKMPKVRFTAPGAGRVTEINRGQKRRFESLVIELDGSDEKRFKSYALSDISSLGRFDVTELLIESGLWTAMRTRPFSKVADPDTAPNALFVTAADTHPHAPCVKTILAKNKQDFKTGLSVLSKLTDGELFVCSGADFGIDVSDLKKVTHTVFEGPHPSGNVGTHIHFLSPAGRNRLIWHINFQDVISIGKLFVTGRLSVDRVISMSGPSVKNPRLIQTRVGAALPDLISGELKSGDNRIVSGSLLSGRTVSGSQRFLGRYHQQCAALSEGRKREFLGWLKIGANLFSVKNITLSALFPGKSFNFNTALHGASRAIVPIGSYEAVFPLDILPTFLFRAMAVDDIEDARNLGCLELDEEDLALCAFVCPSKIEFGPMLRRNLTLIEKDW